MNKYFEILEGGLSVKKEAFRLPDDYENVLRIISTQVAQPVVSPDSFLLSYGDLYAYRNAGKQSEIVSGIFFRLAIPEYSPLRFEILHSGRLNGAGFKIRLNIFNRKQQEVELTQKVGALYADQYGSDYFLSSPTIGFIDAWDVFKSDALKVDFNKDMNFRLSSYGKLVNAYDQLEIQGMSLLDTFKVKIIDDLEYNLIGNEDGTLDVVPAFDKELGAFNNTINRIVEDATGVSNNLDLKDLKRKKNYKIIFSEAASEKWKAFSEIKKLDRDTRSDLIRSGKFLSEFPPKQIIGSIFSDRVTGFILDSQEKIGRDNQATENWGEGFDEVSNLLQSTSGSAYSISLTPAPELYSEIKGQIAKISKLQEQQVSDAKQATGAVHTTPILEPISIFIDGLKDEFTLLELETLVERIEKNNKPEILDSDVELAKSILRDATKNGEYVAKWNLIDGEEVVLPIKSLDLALKDLSQTEVSSKSLSVQIAETISVKSDSDETGLSDDWYVNEDIQKFSKSDSFRNGVQLRSHQVKGYAWLHGIATHVDITKICGSRGALLADDMGLGKTIQVIRLIDSFRTEFRKAQKPILVVGPVSLLKTSWEQDGIKAFFNDDFLKQNKVIHLKDIPRVVPRELILKEVLSFENSIQKDPTKHFQSLELSDELNQYLNIFKSKLDNSIVLCSYETLRSRIFELAAVDFSLVILDEAQKIKNSSTGQSKAAKALKAEMKVAMTGTPIENSISDLWSICDFAVKDYLGSLKGFKERYLVRIAKAIPGSPERKIIAEELERELKPIWLRRTKKEVLKNGEIPPITHYDSCLDSNGTLINKHLVQMSDAQYEVFQTQVGYFNESKSGHKLSAIRNMLEACYAPWWAKGLTADILNIAQLFKLSPKLSSTFDILTEIAVNDEKVIIFANIIELQHELSSLIHQWYFKTFSKSVDCEYFNGDFTLDQRTAILSRFKNSKGFKALIISPRSGGAGLNIVEANHVIHYTREWNPAVERQATDRVHRLGQKKNVFVYYPTSSLTNRNKISAEEHLANILRSKREVIDDFTVSEGDLGLGENQFGNFHFSTNETILTPEGVITLGPHRFEKLIGLYYSSLGYEVKQVGGAGDGGCDVVAFSSNKNILVQVKFTEINQAQGTPAINQVRGAKSSYEKTHGCIFSLVGVTNSIFSPNAHAHAISGDIVELIEGDKIKEFIKNSKILISQLK